MATKTISTVAQRVLDENNYETADIHATSLTALTRVEYMIDNVIDYVNLEIGSSIADLSGSVGSKSLTCDEKYLPLIKLLSALMIRAYTDRGPNAAVSGLSVTSVLADPQYDLFTKVFERSINRLRTRSFKRT